MIHFDNHFLLALLPPGAFFAMGFLIAAKNAIDNKVAERKPKVEEKVIERVRVSFDG